MEGEKSTIVRSPLGFEREYNGIMLYRIWAAAIVCYTGKASAWHTRVPICLHECAACTRATTGRRTGDIASRYVGYVRYAGTIFWFWSVRQIRSPFVTEARAFGTRERTTADVLLPTACPAFYSSLHHSSRPYLWILLQKENRSRFWWWK